MLSEGAKFPAVDLAARPRPARAGEEIVDDAGEFLGRNMSIAEHFDGPSARFRRTLRR